MGQKQNLPTNPYLQKKSDNTMISYDKFVPKLRNPEKTFTVLSYNILAQCYSNSFIWKLLYTHVKSNYLSFEYRNKLVLNNLKEFNADIICLQEVDNFSTHYEQQIQSLGYTIVYQKKIDWKDGVCLGFKTSKFTLKKQIAWNCKTQNLEEYKNNTDFNRSWGSVIALELEFNDTQDRILVVTAHLYQYVVFTKEFVQFNEVAQIMKLIYESGVKNVVFCGDFNQQKYNVGQRLITQHPLDQLKPSNNDEKSYQKIKNIYQKLFNGIDFSQIKLKNTFDYYVEELGQPSYTFYLKKFQGQLDYMYYNEKGQIAPIKFLEKPCEQELQAQGGGLPNSYYPSDHLPLLVEFGFLQEKE